MIQKELNKNELLFRQLYEAIRCGEIPNGARLATELELAEQYGCSRITVRSGLRQLEELKLIRRVRGNGTYVSSEGVRFSGRRNIAIVAVEVRANDFDEVDPYFGQLMSGLLRHGNIYDYAANLITMRPEEQSFMEAFGRQNINLLRLRRTHFRKAAFRRGDRRTRRRPPGISDRAAGPRPATAKSLTSRSTISTEPMPRRAICSNAATGISFFCTRACRRRSTARRWRGSCRRSTSSG